MEKRSKHPATATAFLLATLLVVSGAAQISAVVVCVGLDGHADVESLFDNCCLSDAGAACDDASDRSDADSACGDCTDLQVQERPLRSKEIQAVQPDSDGASPVCTPRSGSGVEIRTVDITGMDQHWRSLASLSTVVLLT